jgi:GNAT superfamily N-acetyltransferase
MPRCTIRHACATDDFSPFLGASSLRWNYEQVYVAEYDGLLVGMALVFDGGHDVVLVDAVRVVPAWDGKGLWVRFLRQIQRDCKARGRTVLMGYANNDTVMDIALRFGAQVGTQAHYLLCKRIE